MMIEAMPAAIQAVGDPLPVASPSSGEAPANLLRLSLRFDRPPDELRPDDIDLIDDTSGLPIAAPFLDQALWSPDGRTVTLLFHPGRVKTGLEAHDGLGRALEIGHRVRVEWSGVTVARWRVGDADVTPPRPESWRLSTVRVGSLESLDVALEAPLDGLAEGLIAVQSPTGGRVPGTATLSSDALRWVFTPATPWVAGDHQLRLHPELEDPSGNRVDAPFEHRPSATPTRESPPAPIRFSPSREISP